MFSVAVNRNRRMLLLVFGVMISLICIMSYLTDPPMAAAVDVFKYDRLVEPLGTKLDSSDAVGRSWYNANVEEAQAAY